MALRFPLDTYTLTQGFGANAAYYKQFGQNGHNGWDLGAKAGTPVYAAEAGTIAFEGWGQNHSWMGKIAGISVIIAHNGLHTGYAHLASTVISKGQAVSKGQLIGYVGATGTATGPHLHFEVFPASPNFSNGFAGRIDPGPHVSNVKTATADEIKKAYKEILERDADAGGINHYLKYTIAFVRQDLTNSAEKRALDARKAAAAKAAAEKAAADAAQKAADAKKAADAQKALAAAQKAEADRLAAEAELARIAEEERIAREAAEAKAKVQQELAEKAKEAQMATTAEIVKTAQELAEDVASSEVVQELVAGVSKKTKFIVYVIGDSLIGLSGLVPGIAVVAGWDDLVKVAALSGVLLGAGGFLLVMFGIYKSSKKQ